MAAGGSLSPRPLVDLRFGDLYPKWTKKGSKAVMLTMIKEGSRPFLIHELRDSFLPWFWIIAKHKHGASGWKRPPFAYNQMEREENNELVNSVRRANSADQNNLRIYFAEINKQKS